MKHSFCIVFLAVFFATGFCASSVFAQTIQTPPDTQSLILELQSQITALQTRIAELKASEGQAPLTFVFDRDLFRGGEGDDVRKLQEFFAKDQGIYPNGLITGYFGVLTEKAVQRFQEKHNIVSTGAHDTVGYGRVGPKTRAKLNTLLAEKPAVPESQPKFPQQESRRESPPIEDQTVTKSPEPEAATSIQAVSPQKPTPNIKSGAGSAITNSVFDFGTGAIHYKELGRLGESGAFYLGNAGGGQTSPSLSVANVTSFKKGSACDPHDASPFADYNGPHTICEFTDAANYTFSNTEELVRFHEKSSSCYDGIILFRQNGLYGGIEPEDITKKGDLTYHYWYDASGGSDFSDACLLGKNNASPAFALVLDSLADVLNKIKREIKKLSQ